MSEPKTFASLSSGLLARKGAARPAMRPQGFGQMGAGIEDLGWNDMGYAPPTPQADPAYEEETVERAPSPITALTPMGAEPAEEEEFEPAPPVVEQQRAAIAASFAEPIEKQAEVDRIVLATKTKKVSEPEGAQELPEAEEAQAEEDFEQPEPAEIVTLPAKVRAKAERSTRAKAAFTLRLEADRHLKLRLACAVTGRSAQQLVTEALDRLLETKPEIRAMAEQLPVKAGKSR